MFIYIYIYIYICLYENVYMKMFESMVTLCYKDKVKGKSTKVLYACMGKVIHIAMHVKSTKSLPTHNVIYSIVQWYLKEMNNLSEVPFWVIGDRKTVSL